MTTNNKSAIEKAKRYLLRTCGQGNTCACTKAKRVLVAERMEIHGAAMVTFAEVDEKDSHVNRLPFRGILLILDQASTKPPHGSRGHRIYVRNSVAEKHLDSLVGMAINYAPGGLDSHETRHKVGVITKAWISGNKVWVSGFCWKKDFPEAMRDLKHRGLGMSMELADVYVRDEDEPVWHLEDFTFTGATILLKSAAAYYDTSLTVTAAAEKRLLNERTIAAAIKAGIDSALLITGVYEQLDINLGFITNREETVSSVKKLAAKATVASGQKETKWQRL